MAASMGMVARLGGYAALLAMGGLIGFYEFWRLAGTVVLVLAPASGG